MFDRLFLGIDSKMRAEKVHIVMLDFKRIIYLSPITQTKKSSMSRDGFARTQTQQ